MLGRMRYSAWRAPHEDEKPSANPPHLGTGEERLLTVELIEGYVELGLRVIVTVALATATVVCAMKGAPWPTPSITGTASSLLLASRARPTRP
jgi:hypothetical protein